MILSYKWDGLDGMGWVGSLCGATIRASLRDANKKKINHLKEIKDRDESNAVKVGIMFGVKVGDEHLSDFVEKPANVWGKAEIGEEAKEVLNLGKKFRLHQRLDMNV